jgi:2-hydroxychromene-2-carboxylate isomerase
LSKIVPYIAQALFSTGLLNFKRKLIESKRRKQGAGHVVTAYLRINDPYSFVLIQVLKQLQDRYDIEYEFRTILDLQADMYPAPNLWEQNALVDGKYLASLYALDFPVDAPKQPDFTQLENRQITAQLLHWELQPGYLDNAQKLFSAYWTNDKAAVNALLNSDVINSVECYGHHLKANQAKLKDNGHYLSGLLHYGKECYWGVDRLQYLERRLNDLNIHKTEKAVRFDQTHLNFCKHMTADQVAKAVPQANKKPITMYWSLRSPYSYLAIVRARQLAKHYNTPLIIKPVLPMVMRRMLVPNNKKSYIASDVKRESLQYGIEFGRVADPLGAGVERCYSIYEYALSQNKGNELLEAWAKSVWSQGINSATDSGVQKIIKQVGLDWQQVKPLLHDQGWRIWVQTNLAQLYSHGLWGVPSLTYNGCQVFGQDRIDMIERALADDLNGQ